MLLFRISSPTAFPVLHLDSYVTSLSCSLCCMLWCVINLNLLVPKSFYVCLYFPLSMLWYASCDTCVNIFLFTQVCFAMSVFFFLVNSEGLANLPYPKLHTYTSYILTQIYVQASRSGSLERPKFQFSLTVQHTNPWRPIFTNTGRTVLFTSDTLITTRYWTLEDRSPGFFFVVFTYKYTTSHKQFN